MNFRKSLRMNISIEEKARIGNLHRSSRFYCRSKSFRKISGHVEIKKLERWRERFQYSGECLICQLEDPGDGFKSLE